MIEAQRTCSDSGGAMAIKRLYFLVPDVATAKRAVDELLLSHVELRHIHVVPKRGTPLLDLPEATLLQKSDFVPAIQRGIVLGGATGIVVGALALALRLISPAVAGGMLLAHALAGAGVGSWLGGMAGMNVGNTRIKRFGRAIERGEVLVIADVLRERVDAVKKLIQERIPEVRQEGIEPLVPPFP
jgi:hypothetical protein